MLETPGHPELKWRRSSRCAHIECVEVAFVDGSTLVRDSKRPAGARLRFRGEAWRAFIAAVKRGEFDA